MSLVTLRDEGAPALVVVVGETEAVDVVDQPRPQVVQGLLAAHAEAHDRDPLGEAGDDQRGDGDQRHRTDEPDLDRVVADDAAVDGLLDRDRHDHPTAGADRRDQPRHAKPLS